MRYSKDGLLVILTEQEVREEVPRLKGLGYRWLNFNFKHEEGLYDRNRERRVIWRDVVGGLWYSNKPHLFDMSKIEPWKEGDPE